MNPGATTRPSASMVFLAAVETRPSSVIFPAEIPTSARRAGAPVPSINVPFFTTMSCMARKRSHSAPGTVVVLEHSSRILKDNPLGDPYVRKLAVWLPPQYDDGAPRRRFPVLYDLVGFTGSGI